MMLFAPSKRHFLLFSRLLLGFLSDNSLNYNHFHFCTFHFFFAGFILSNVCKRKKNRVHDLRQNPHVQELLSRK